MAAAFRSSSSLSSGTRTNSTLTAPAGIVDGDWLTIVFYIEANVTPTPPTGFSQIQTGGLDTVGGADNESFDVYVYRKKAASESGNYTVTHASSFTAGYMEADSGGDGAATNGEDFAATVNAVDGEVGGTNYTALGGTTTVDESLVGFYFGSWDPSNAVTPPGGTTPTFTERLDSASVLIYAATGVMTTAGATGNKTATGATQDTTGGMVAFLTSVKAAAAGGRTTKNTRAWELGTEVGMGWRM